MTSGLIRKNCQLRTGGYNCEGFLSAAAYIVDLLEDLNVLFLSETWVSRAEATLLGDVLRSYGVNSVQIFQTFAMDAPPGAGEGRRQGGDCYDLQGRRSVYVFTVANWGLPTVSGAPKH